MLQVGYHGSSGTHTLVCDGTLASGWLGDWRFGRLGILLEEHVSRQLEFRDDMI